MLEKVIIGKNTIIIHYNSSVFTLEREESKYYDTSNGVTVLFHHFRESKVNEVINKINDYILNKEDISINFQRIYPLKELKRVIGC